MGLNRANMVMLVASLLLLAATLPRPVVVAEGPREDDLVIQFYSNLTAAFAALKTGDIDLVLGSLTKDLTALAVQDPNLVLVPVAGYDMYEFDLNNNWSITDYPGIRSPMNYTAMRQAITWLTDKNYIVDVICEGFAERIDQMIAAPLKGWANTSMWYPNYPYEYDPLAAKAVLDSTFPEGTTPNPHYDPNFPGAAQYIRTYPIDHSLAGRNLDPLKICVRIDDPKRLEAGRMVYGNMRKHGIPCDVQESPAVVLYLLVMDDMNYHFYTGSWSVGQFPPPSLYGLYHSMHAFPGGGNYVTGNGTHPKLDQLLSDGNYATSHSQAVTACRKAAGYMAEECVTIPLFSRRSYYCYSNKLLGVVNQEGQGPENAYTFMNAYKADGSPIHCATISPPHDMHIIYSSWEAEWQCLDRMNLVSGVDTAPYSRALDMNGFTRNLETTMWDDNGILKTKLAMTFRSDGYFVKPVSGDQGRNVNATHYYISAWCHYPLQPNSFLELHHIDITGPYDIEVYFGYSLSYWNTYYCQGPLLPVDTWADSGLITKHNETIIDPATPGVIAITESPVWFTAVTFNSIPLTLGTDYNIVDGHLYIYSALGPGTLETKYWAVGNFVGYTPGNLPWETIFEGAGMYYATGFTPGTGGGLTLKRNPYYWMETPPLGEVDFTRKPNGACKVDIFDLVLAAGAYGSQGVAVPSARWFAGADVAPPAGKIDIFDMVTIASQYGQEYDFPE